MKTSHSRLLTSALLAPLALSLHACHPPKAADPLLAAIADGPPPPAAALPGDGDGDGLQDDEEQALAERFAPVVTLEKNDWTRPASTRWLLERTAARGGYDKTVRSGSADPSQWTTYVHVFPSHMPEAVHIQYWFFYPYNDGPLFFDHEADWEHITVTLDAARNPLGVAAARHSDSAPGRWRSWDRIRKLGGTHPEILSARGSHASYFDKKDAKLYDMVGRCRSFDEPCEHPLWMTWQAGGLVNLGERRAPLATHHEVMAFAGRWGDGDGLLPGTDSPRGPAFQRGWCVPQVDACR